MSPQTPGTLRIGEGVDDAGKRNGAPTEVAAADFTTHGVIVGMTGSGKTGLAIAMIEETLRSGIPVLMIDPKGDLGNLCLTFPKLEASDFSPWIPKESDAAAIATQWKEGLASWSLDGSDIEALRAAALVTIFTPGSKAGVPLNVIGSLAPPAGDDEEARHDEIESFVSGLLNLVGLDTDPLSSREHILLSNLINHAWVNGSAVDMATLIAQIQQPPLRKLGVIELESFFPTDDRAKFAAKLNGLLASPSFGSWLIGEPLDIGRLLFTNDGRPRASVISIAHCSEEERMFLVTLILSKVVAWMRQQAGTTDLRALIYMDEVVGYVPPTAAPPSKKPILTLLKQARAFGVGLVVATQNPVDVDYKALSNAGTWLIGRLQTEQDKARLMDGLTAVGGAVDIESLSATISGLDKRQFVWHKAGRHAPSVFTSRWAMSYLAGPLTKEQISVLMTDQRIETPQAVPATAAADPEPSGTPATTSATAAPAEPQGAPATSATPAAADPIAADETPVPPKVHGDIPVRYLDPAAPWAATAGAAPTGSRYRAAITARVQLRYDETSLDFVASEEYEAIVTPITAAIDGSALLQVDYDDRDLRTEAPQGIRYVLPAVPVDTATFWKSAEIDLRNHLVQSRSMTVLQNQQLKLASRPGESREEFLARCQVAAEEREDAAADKLRIATQKKLDALEMTVMKAKGRVEQLQTDTTTRRGNELLQGATSVLGALLGGKKSASSIARSIGSAASRRSESARTAQRLETAKQELDEREQRIGDLESELAQEITALDTHWAAVAADVSEVAVALEKTDVSVSQLALVWIPTG